MAGLAPSDRARPQRGPARLRGGVVALVDASGLPRPRRNATSRSGRFLEVDCLWRAQRWSSSSTAAPCTGPGSAFEADRERDRLLVGAGWRVVRVTWRQLRDEGPSIAADSPRTLGASR